MKTVPTPKGVDSNELQRMIGEEIKIVIEENREKIVKRAHKRLRELKRNGA